MREELEKIIDLSIVQADIGTGNVRQEKGFWRLALVVEDMAFGVRHLIDKVSVDRPICRDIASFVEKIATNHEHQSGVGGETIEFERPVEYDDYVAECTPQFILRNLRNV